MSAELATALRAAREWALLPERNLGDIECHRTSFVGQLDSWVTVSVVARAGCARTAAGGGLERVCPARGVSDRGWPC